MSNLSVQYTSAGQQGPFSYSSLDLIEGTPTANQVKVYVDGDLKTNGVDYQLDENQRSIYFNYPYPSTGSAIVLQRMLSVDRVYTYHNGDSLNATQLNANYDHLRLLSENLQDYSGNAPTPRPADNLFELADVDQSSVPQDGDILQWNASDAIWRAAPLQLNLPELLDVRNDMSPNEGDVLSWDNSKWDNEAYTQFRPTEMSQLWGSPSHAVGFVERPSVSAAAVTSRPPLANEIPTVRDIQDMFDDVADVSGREVGLRVNAALDLLSETPLEAALLAAVEWKYGVRFRSWRDYENATKDWPELNGPVNYGDLLPDGTEAIIRTSATSQVTDSSGPTFTKNPNRRFLPAKMFGRVAGAMTLDPGVYVAYPGMTNDIETSSAWIRNLGGLIRQVQVNGWRVNVNGDHILQITVQLDCAMSTPAIQVITDRQGLMPMVSDYSGQLGILGIYNVFPQGFTMNIPTAWFVESNEYQPLHLRIYGDRSMEASVTTTVTTD